MRYRIRCRVTDPDTARFVLLSLPLVLGLGMTFSNEIFFRFFGSYLGEGGTSSINYALRTMGFVAAVFGQATGVAFYPYLSRLAAEQKFAEMSALLNGVLTRIATWCIPACLLLVVIAPQVIAVLYEHGRFDSASTARTAQVFAIYLAGAFAFAASVFTARPFYAVQKPVIPMIVSTAVSLSVLPLYYFTTRAWGARGIAASAVCGISLQFLILYGIWHARYGNQGALTAIIRKFGLIAAIGVVGAVCVWFIKPWAMALALSFGKLTGNLLVCCIAALPFGGLVLLLYHVTGVQRIGGVLGALRWEKLGAGWRKE